MRIGQFPFAECLPLVGHVAIDTIARATRDLQSLLEGGGL